jgi:hypothetical protein
MLWYCKQIGGKRKSQMFVQTYIKPLQLKDCRCLWVLNLSGKTKQGSNMISFYQEN